MIGLARRSADSIFGLEEGWNPSRLNDELGDEISAEFDLRDLITMAGELE